MSEQHGTRAGENDRPASRRLALTGLGAFALSGLGMARFEAPAAAKQRCRRRTRKCKSRCDRRYASGSLELAACRGGCGIGCVF